MCGIAGMFGPRGTAADADRVRRMTQMQLHRGPDDGGLVAFALRDKTPSATTLSLETSGDDPAEPVAVLGHRRLSIIDLSAAGHQPMTTADERLWITYNGELYNYLDIRKELEAAGDSFVSATDTEVVLKAFARWGPEAVRRFDGMFAFAILDLRGGSPELFLARDRFGVKPLYWAWDDDVFVFASELRAVMAGRSQAPRLSASAVEQFLMFLAVPEPGTIVAGVEKLLPGHWLTVDATGSRTHQYWAHDTPREPIADDRPAGTRLRELLYASVARQSMADVPVGVFLSGGLDSSAIVAGMVATGHPPHRAHTVAFRAADQAYEGFPDDLPFAKDIAERFSTPHDVRMLEPDLASMYPDLMRKLDDPIADPAILPLHLMCEAASSHVKVLLSGMGGDEILGGYRRHAVAPVLSWWYRLPKALRTSVFVPLVERLPSAGSGRFRPLARRVKRFIRGVEHASGHAAVGLSMWTDQATVRGLMAPRLRERLDARSEPWAVHAAALKGVRDHDALDAVMAVDTQVFLPSHNLNYTDRVSMASSVEVRVPFLDNAFVDFARDLPTRDKVRGRETKVALRDAMEGVLPDSVVRRGKAGLGAPIRSWLVNHMAHVVADVLAPERIDAVGVLDAAGVAKLWDALKSGQEDTSYQIWAALSLQLWAEAQGITERDA